MPLLCVTCTKNITVERFPGVKCSSCMKTFHIKCVGASDDLVRNINSGSASWICQSCRNSSSRRSIIDYSESGTTADPTLHDVMAALNSLREKFSVMENSLQYMSGTIDELKNQVSLLTKENSTIKKKMIDMERDHDEYVHKISWLEANADVNNQLNIANNIIMCGLPVEIADTNNIFISIAGKLGVDISINDINSIVKLNHKNANTTNSFKNAFIIKLNTIELKNTILNNFRKKKSLFLDEIDVSYGKVRIILLHQFTQFQSKLYNEAKQFKTKHNYRFLWCINNRILLRSQPEAIVHHIRTFGDLARLQKCLPTVDTSIGSLDHLHG